MWYATLVELVQDQYLPKQLQLGTTWSVLYLLVQHLHQAEIQILEALLGLLQVCEGTHSQV